MIRFLLSFSSCVLLSGTSIARPAEAGDFWQQRNPGSNRLGHNCLATNGSLLVAAGYSGNLGRGTLSVSSDRGTTWQLVHQTANQALLSVASGGGRFVAVGVGMAPYPGKAYTMTSTGGREWHGAMIPTAAPLRDVAWTGGRFVAVGDNGTILTSTDGANWQASASGTTAYLTDVFIAGGGQVIALGRGGSSFDEGRAVISPDEGLTWSGLNVGTTAMLHSGTAWENGAMIWSDSQCILWNGVTWETVQKPVVNSQVYQPIYKVHRSGQEYVATGEDGVIYTSKEGRNWYREESLYLGGPADAAAIGGEWVIAGQKGQVLRTAPGALWSNALQSQTSATMRAVVRASDRFLAYGSFGTTYESLDGATWTQLAEGSSTLWQAAVARGNVTVVVGNYGSFRTTTAGVRTDGSLGQSIELNGVAASPTLFAAVGKAGLIYSSPDGIAWTSRQSGTPRNLTAVAWGGNAFHAVGEGGTHLTSPDGISWTADVIGEGSDLHGISFTTRGWIIVGKDGAIFHSGDGSTWTMRISGIPYDLNAVVETADGVMVLGAKSSAAWSPDGVTWKSQPVSGDLRDFTSAVYHEGTLVAVSGVPGVTYTSTIRVSVFPHALEFLHAPLPDLKAVEAREDGLIAVGGPGQIWSSPDGKSWNAQPRLTNWFFEDIHTAGNVSVIASDKGLLASTDGQHWIACDIVPTAWNSSLNSFKALAHGNGKWVCGAEDGDIIVSEDGFHWRQVPTPTVGSWDHIIKVIWSNGRFVAITSEANIFTSSDGEAWTAPALPANRGNSFTQIAWSNGRFLVPTSLGSKVLTSTDGLSWTLEDGTLPGGAFLGGLRTLNGRLWSFGLQEMIRSSADGVTWVRNSDSVLNIQGSSGEAPDKYDIKDLTHDGSQYIAVGTDGFITTSSDGFQWTYRECGPAHELNVVEHVKDRFIAISRDSLISSPDGTVWTKHSMPAPVPTPLQAIGWNGSIAVVLGEGSSYYSTDLWSWTLSPQPPSGSFNKVIWSGDRFIAVGRSGAKAISHDGMSWTNSSAFIGSDLNIASSGAQVLATSSSGTYSTIDGITWTKLVAPWAPTGNGQVIWTGEKFLLYGIYGSMIAESPDGQTGTVIGGSTGSPVPDFFTGNSFYDVTSSLAGKTLSRSQDGITWEPLDGMVPNDVQDFAASDNQLIAVGYAGLVLTSSATDSLSFQTLLTAKGYSTEGDLTMDGDRNGDGIANAVAYYLGLPLEGATGSADRESLPKLEEGDEGHELKFMIAEEDAADFLDLVIERSTGLDEWDEVSRRGPGGIWSGPAAVSETGSPDGRKVVTLKVQPGETPAFWRARVVARE